MQSCHIVTTERNEKMSSCPESLTDWGWLISVRSSPGGISLTLARPTATAQISLDTGRNFKNLFIFSVVMQLTDLNVSFLNLQNFKFHANNWIQDNITLFGPNRPYIHTMMYTFNLPVFSVSFSLNIWKRTTQSMSHCHPNLTPKFFYIFPRILLFVECLE